MLVMSNKAKFIQYLQEFLGIFITAVVCYGIYHWGKGHDRECFAITLITIAYLFVCFFNAIFNHSLGGMVQRIVSGLTIIAFANEMYDYNNIVDVFPILKNVAPMIFVFILLGCMLIVLIIIKVMMFIYENCDADTNNNVVPANESDNGHEGNNSGGANASASPSNSNGSNAWMVLYFIFLMILIGGGAALFAVLYNRKDLKQQYDFFEVVMFLLKDTGSIVMVLLAVFIEVIFLIEMIKMIIARMKVFAASLKNDGNSDTAPLYLLSIILDVVVCYLTYKFTGINMDSFYEFVNDGRYLALPLMILFVGIAFVIFLRLIHATLVLLVDMKPETVKSFLKDVNEKTKITERLVEMIKTIVDIILDTLLTALKFVQFIPDFFGTLYVFVLEDEEDFKLSEDETEEENKAGN